jgi:hypothetical protein
MQNPTDNVTETLANEHATVVIELANDEAIPEPQADKIRAVSICSQNVTDD